MNPIERAIRMIDRMQRSWRPAAFVFGVVKKFGDDQASSLAALLTYYGFLSVFPLLLLLVTVLGLVAGGGGSIEHRVLHSALAQFPVIGQSNDAHGQSSLADNISSLHRSSPAGLAVGIAGLLWGSLGISQNGQYAMAQVWNVPKIDRPGFVPRLLRSLLLLLSLGVFLAVSTGLSGLATFNGSHSAPARVGVLAASLVVNIAMFVVVYRILTPKTIAWRLHLPGAVIGGVAWSVLQSVGAFLVGHELRNMSQVYGFFATVLGLLWWIYLAAQVVLYSAEINVVWARRLWPRSMVQPPLTPADRRVLAAEASVEQRRPEVHVSIDETGGDAPPAPAPVR